MHLGRGVLGVGVYFCLLMEISRTSSYFTPSLKSPAFTRLSTLHRLYFGVSSKASFPELGDNVHDENNPVSRQTVQNSYGTRTLGMTGNKRKKTFSPSQTLDVTEYRQKRTILPIKQEHEVRNIRNYDRLPHNKSTGRSDGNVENIQKSFRGYISKRLSKEDNATLRLREQTRDYNKGSVTTPCKLEGKQTVKFEGYDKRRWRGSSRRVGLGLLGRRIWLQNSFRGDLGKRMGMDIRSTHTPSTLNVIR